MVKDPFKKWDRVDTFCAVLVDLGWHYFFIYGLSTDTDSGSTGSPTIIFNPSGCKLK